MTLEEAVLLFDRIEQAPGAEAIGIPYCCELPVVMNGAKIYCTRCGRTVCQVGRQWMVDDWGTKGIKMPGGATS